MIAIPRADTEQEDAEAQTHHSRDSSVITHIIQGHLRDPYVLACAEYSLVLWSEYLYPSKV